MQPTATLSPAALSAAERRTLDFLVELLQRELGGALRRGGTAREARERLRERLDAAHRCGATALVDRALEELRLAGARPRRPALRGVAALTPAERRVAELAGQGSPTARSPSACSSPGDRSRCT